MLPLKVAENLSKPLNCSQWQTELIFHLSAMLEGVVNFTLNWNHRRLALEIVFIPRTSW
jgi:hypothetical protein